MDILEGTAQRRPFQFVVIWIGDAQSTYLLVLSVCSFEYMGLVFKIDRCVGQATGPFLGVETCTCVLQTAFVHPRCLLRGCPDDGHANDQMKFPDRNTLIQSDLKDSV